MPIDEPSTPEDRLPEDELDDAPDDALPEDDDVDDAPDAVEFRADHDPNTNEDAALIERARRRFGTTGAIVAGGMLGIEKILQPKVKQEAPVEWEAPGEPLDIDRKGITVPIEDDAIVRSKPGAPPAAGALSRKVTRRRRR